MPEVRRGVPGRFCRVKTPKPPVEMVHHETDIAGKAVQVNIFSALHPAIREYRRQKTLDIIAGVSFEDKGLPRVARCSRPYRRACLASTFAPDFASPARMTLRSGWNITRSITTVPSPVPTGTSMPANW